MITRLSDLKFLFTVAFFLAHVVFLSGCNVHIRGKQRPLIRHERIEGELELVAEKQNDEFGTDLSSRKSTVESFEERLRLETKGDVYDARLLEYSAAIGLGLAQNETKTDGDTVDSTGTLDSYEFTTNLLKNKKVGLRFDTRQSETLVGRQFLGPVLTETERTGFSVPLQLQHWPMQFRYSDSNTVQRSRGTVSSAIDRVSFDRENEQIGYSLSHNSSDSSRFSFEFERDEARQRGINFLTLSKNDFYTGRHDLDLDPNGRSSLVSFVRFNDRTEPVERSDSLWSENLRLQHTDNFLTKYDFRMTDLSQKSLGLTEELKTESIGGSASFKHKLYESLFSHGGIRILQTEQRGGLKDTYEGANIGFNYRKKNPWGTLFNTYSLLLSELEQTGGSDTGTVVGESHIVPDDVNNPFLEVELDRTGINVNSIVVEDGNGAEFIETVNYDVVSAENGRMKLRIIPNIGTNPDFTSAGQEFFVSYIFTLESERTESSVHQNLRIRQSFTNGLSVSYIHSRQDEDVSSSTVAIAPDDFRSHLYGVGYTSKRFSVFADLGERTGSTFSSTTERIGGSYRWLMGRRVRCRLFGSKAWLAETEPTLHESVILSAGGSVTGRLSEKYSVSTALTYRNEEDSFFGDTEGVDFKSELEYRYRQLSVRAGVEFDFLDRQNTEYETTRLYFRVKRFF